MSRVLRAPIAAALLAFGASAQPPPGGAPVTTATLLDEMADLARLARWPEHEYRTVQYSSFDRRSTAPESPAWFANADGFGREPVPGFEQVLREPDADGVGEYLLADVAGPGAIVRGWSAGMGGRLRVFLDDSREPVFDGDGYAFFARRSQRLLEQAGVARIEPADRFVQQDADYLPMPFARRLRIIWEGRLRELHFYHLGVRRYAAGTEVTTFRVEDLRVPNERQPRSKTRDEWERQGFWKWVPAPGGDEFVLEHGKPWSKTIEPEQASAIRGLHLWFEPDDLPRTLRGTVLRIFFDGAQRPQVEAPAGDFFGSGPGSNVFASGPMAVGRDGSMGCAFVMPFRESARIELERYAPGSARARLSTSVAPFPFDDRTLYFRAKWRVDHELDSGGGARPIDLPFLFVHGQGRLVGAACMLMNPSPAPAPGGNWWGEGDEKILVDGERTPSTFGTGSEDYFNYAWSRPDLFAHPYCGQPLDSGPGTAGYVSNHRWHILDDVPFEHSLAFLMELWTHNPTPGLSYARIVYHYARPDALDDHRALQARELVIPELPAREPQPLGAAARATFAHFEDLKAQVTGGTLEQRAQPLASRHRELHWLPAAAGDRLAVELEIPKAGEHAVNIVAVHRDNGGAFRAFLGGAPLVPRGPRDYASLETKDATRLLSIAFEPRMLEAGKYRLELESLGPLPIGLDYAWVQLVRERPIRVEGALEGEDLRVVRSSPGLEWEQQGMDARWSNGAHLWVRASEGAWLELALPVERAQRANVELGLTRSFDYGVLEIAIDGNVLARDVDTHSGRADLVAPAVGVALGEVELRPGSVLRLAVTRARDAQEPGTYFGVDWVRVR